MPAHALPMVGEAGHGPSFLREGANAGGLAGEVVVVAGALPLRGFLTSKTPKAVLTLAPKTILHH
eukprot:2433271-Pyramimonas_sp.AAC.1